MTLEIHIELEVLTKTRMQRRDDWSKLNFNDYDALLFATDAIVRNAVVNAAIFLRYRRDREDISTVKICDVIINNVIFNNDERIIVWYDSPIYSMARWEKSVVLATPSDLWWWKAIGVTLELYFVTFSDDFGKCRIVGNERRFA